MTTATSRPAPVIDDALVQRLVDIVGQRRVLRTAGELEVYSADGLPAYHRRPSCAVFPGTRDEVIAVVRALADAHVPFVPRGAGTGLSGGALADGVVLLGLNRLNRILSLDPDARLAVVEPGVVNVALSRAAAPYGLYYAPDPSSQAACTIGGNVAENAGGPHCLKYGVTTNHVAALTVVLADGQVVSLGHADGEADGYDLVGAFVGSEGCFGVVLDVTVRLTPTPEAVRTLLADFSSLDAAAHAVSAIVASGIVPAALEMLDAPTIRMVEASIYAAGYPVDAAGVLLIELDGALAGLEHDVAAVDTMCKAAGARTVRVARDEAERARLWQGRKKAFGAMGRLSPHLVVQDAVVPRSQLPAVLARIQAIAVEHAVTVCNVFHAGDGNVHPNIAYDANDADESARVHAAMRAIMQACIAAGGTITGEHGVGLDKLPYMDAIFSAESLRAMCDLREVFDPERRLNPGKVVPIRACREWHMAPAARRRVDGEVRVLMQVRDVAEQVREAAASKTPLRIAGAGGWLHGGRPVRATRTLDLHACAGVTEYVPDDFTLSARAGTTLREIADATRPHGQWLALDPYGDDAGTLGATIATASAGPHATAFGPPRDQVLGIEFVNGAGAVIHGGGRVVKNVAGFDLVRLTTGAWGTLGVITSVTVRLRALPAAESCAAMVGTSSADVQQMTAALHALPTTPLAAELLHGELAGHLGLAPRATLLVRIGGNPGSLRAQRQALQAIAPFQPADEDTWRALRAVAGAGDAAWRLSGYTATMGQRWERAQQSVAAAGGGWVHASLLRGVARCIVSGARTPEAAPRVAAALALAAPARLVGESLPDAAWATLRASAADPLSRQIRAAFDPGTILNPGIMGELI